MTNRFTSLAAVLGLACLGMSGCGEKPSADAPGPHPVHTGTPAAGKSAAAAPPGLPAAVQPAERGAASPETEKTMAQALAGRWEARFPASSAVIEIETANGGLNGSVREQGKDPVRIEIGIVTADGFLFETWGGARYLWIARLTGDVLSGRREKVDNGSVERFDGYRMAALPPL